jgi:hypothetical protein
VTLVCSCNAHADKGVAAEGNAGGAHGGVRSQLRLHHGLGVSDGRSHTDQGTHLTLILTHTVV